MALTRYQQVGKKAIQEFLSNHPESETFHLWLLTEKADCAAKDSGMKKNELFDSIYEYECLLPRGTKTGHVGIKDNSMYSVFNPYFDGVACAQIVHPLPGVYDTGIDTFANEKLEF